MLEAIWRHAWIIAIAAAFLAAAAPVRAADAPVVIVAFGDSLTAGFQLPQSKSFAAQLDSTLNARGMNVRVENAGVSGDTAAAGLARTEWSVPDNTDAVILELGANDALRGFNPAETERALDGILAKLQARGIDVLIAGMEAPPNLGKEYTDAFRAIYPRLAQKYGSLLYPFFLEGVAMKPELCLPDGLHPNPKGVDVMVNGILPQVEALVARVKARKKHA
jgi:acyl-CoA thioesterase-1